MHWPTWRPYLGSGLPGSPPWLWFLGSFYTLALASFAAFVPCSGLTGSLTVALVSLAALPLALVSLAALACSGLPCSLSLALAPLAALPWL
jgi:hypothetical protein